MMKIEDCKEITLGRFTYRPETVFDPIEKANTVKLCQIFNPTGKEVDYMMVTDKKTYNLAIMYLRFKNDKQAK